MPAGYGCRFHQHHGVEDLGPDSVKPHPEYPVGREEPRLAGALPAQDGQLMSQGDKFELQGEATTNPKRKQGTEGGQKRDHADDGMTASRKTLCLLTFWSFEQGHPKSGAKFGAWSPLTPKVKRRVVGSSWPGFAC